MNYTESVTRNDLSLWKETLMLARLMLARLMLAS